MKTILITGANRGIGLGIVKQLVLHSPNVELIFAGYRDADRSKVILIFLINIHTLFYHRNY